MRKIILYVLLMLLGVASCTNYDTNPVVPQQYDDVPLVILDTDIGSSTDDLFALEFLYHYQQQGKCKLLGVVVDREGENCAACVDVMNTYFNCGHLPIGLIRSGIKNPTVWIDYKALPTYKNTDGSLMFQRTLSDYSTLPDGWELYRQLLSSQPDHSVTIVSVGFVTCLAQLLQSEPDQYSPLTGVEQVRQKVKSLYIMGGVFTSTNEPEYNFGQGIGFAKTFFSLWPSDIDMVFTPTPTGNCRYQHPGDATWNATMLDKIRTVNKTTQNNVSAIADQVWQFALSHPDGFTLHITSMTQPTEGIAVSYAATLDSHSRDQLDKVVSHALEHDGYVGGWLNKDNGLYYFDSTRLFPEDQLDEALKFGKENGQYSVFILSTGVEVPVE